MNTKNEHNKRWTRDGLDFGVPEVEVLGFDATKRAVPLDDHTHTHAHEFVFMESGRARWVVEGQTYETRGGEVFHTGPDEPHRGSLNIIEPSRFWWIIVRMPGEALLRVGGQAGRWLGLEGEALAAMLHAVGQVPRVTRSGPDILRTLRRLRSALERTDALGPLARQLLVLDLLLQVTVQVETTELPQELLSGLVRIMNELERRPAWTPSLAELAALANVSPSYLHKVFKLHTGLTPRDYIEHNKMNEALRLLKQTPQSITDIALSLGYSSTQHFATAFRRFTGQTPTDWRRS